MNFIGLLIYGQTKAFNLILIIDVDVHIIVRETSLVSLQIYTTSVS